MSDPPKTWYRLRLRTILLLVLLAIVVGSGYSYWSDYRANSIRKAREMMAPEAGSNCRIVCETAVVTGEFVMHNEEWIVVVSGEGDGREQVWIPRHSVKLMSVQD